MQTMPKDLLLVGSIPLSSAEQVFRTCAETVGDLVDCLPDGEYDERIWWVNQQAWRVFHPHPDITTLKRPRPIDGVEQWKPVSVEDYWKFKLDDGVTELRFDDLTYADAAIASYDDFRRLRDEKVIPRDVRFQVCVPMTNSAIDCFFDDPDEYPILNAAYEDAMRREIERMVENIPPEDLVIQWDCCVEILDVEGLFPWTPAEDSFERNVDPFGHVTPAIPEQVLVGFHFCYGTLGGWPMLAPTDLALCVRMANEAVRRAGRRVDYVHMPAPRKAGDAFFAPLQDLEIGETKVFLGIIHHTEGTDPTLFAQRARAASRYLPGFGVSGVCGYGRVEDPMHDVLVGHRANVEALREMSAASRR
jgi:hypothetical protein